MMPTGGSGGMPHHPPPPYPGFSPAHSHHSHSSPASMHSVTPPSASPNPQHFHSPVSHPTHSALASTPKILLGGGPPSAPPALMHATPPHATPPHAAAGNVMPAFSEHDEKNKMRFQIELEFVQCLGNPNYLNFLAQRGYFKDPKFVNYLRYLQYWKEPAYVRYIKYPVCLHFLDLLQHESFRKEIVNSQCAKFLDDQTVLHWQHYTRKRVKLIESASSSTQQQDKAAASASPSSQGSKMKM